MSDQEVTKEWRRVASQLANKLRNEMSIPVIGRITQVMVMPGTLANLIARGIPIVELPSGWIVEVQPLYMVYVYRQNGQAYMIINRVDPFHYEHMYLTDLEMQVVMTWAQGMMQNRIGRFSPVDGGWMWWRK